MKRTSKAVILAAWGIVIAALLVIGLMQLPSGESKLGQEEDIVSVTGVAVTPTAAASETPYPGRTHSPGKTSGTPEVSSAPEKTSKPRDREAPKPREHETPKPHDRKTVKESQQPEETARLEPTLKSAPTPTVKPTPKPVCHFTIECRRILDRPDLWRDGLEEIIPEDGVFFSGKIAYVEGQTVYEALEEICRKQGILLDSRYTPIYETYYVSGIGNLYEFDCGSESGWKYSVNGVLPGVGSSRYTIHAGDEIVFFYDISI